MGSGCIVLASNIANNLEIISDKNTGFIFELKKGNLFNYLKMFHQKTKVN